MKNYQSKEMNARVKALIEESLRVRKLPGPIGVKVVGIAETGAIGIVRSAAVLGSSGMFVIAR